MRHLIFALSAMLSAGLAGAAAAAPADTKFCIKPDVSYSAHPLGLNEIYVRNTFGNHHDAARIGTSCTELRPGQAVRVSSSFSCVGTGDSVTAGAGGDSQTCRVTGVTPYTPKDGDYGN